MSENRIEQTGQVKRRRVFYIPGYDPIPPRRYRELYRKEGAAQAEVCGYSLALSPKTGDRFGWSVAGDFEGQTTHSEIDVLEWADIVQTSMQAGIFRTYLILAQTAWTYIASGALRDLMKLRRGPVIAALYPIGILTVQLLFALLLWWAIAALAGIFGVLAGWIGVALGAVAGFALLSWFKKIDGKVYAYYLMHDYGFSARWRGADPPVLAPRMAAFEDAISEALTQDWDEVLVVGHSSGAHLGVQVLASLIRQGRVPKTGPKLSFLTLGHVVPMVSFLPDAKTLRRDLNFLCTRDELYWLDVTAPGDPCSFALCDPVLCSGLEPEGQKHPKIISAAFTKTLSEPKQAQLRRKFFRLHFQYLCAFDFPDTYDYFAVTAGPMHLQERFKDVQESPSKITVVANRRTEMAA